MHFSIPLPADYRRRETLAFHARDTLAVAERVQDGVISKGVCVQGRPVLLTLDLGTDTAQGHAEGAEASMVAEIEHMLRSMLGLHMDPQPFERQFAEDAVLGPLIRRHPGLRILQCASEFEALSWAIIGQQIHLRFAIALRRTLIQLAGIQQGCGLWCYPEPAAVAELPLSALTSAKFSRAKANTLLTAAGRVADGSLPLRHWRGRPDSELVAQLLAIKGIGPWTVNYTLLRGYADGDGSLHGDVAVQNALQRVLGLPVKPDSAETARVLLRYQPFRALAAAHLWASGMSDE